jgi:RNA polymerase sigma-B factor
MTTTATPRPGSAATVSTPARAALRRRAAAAALRRRNQRVETYRDLVRPLALHYARRCRESWEDLLQVGLLGLIRAAELYRPEQGTPFQAFARPHIRGAILHYLRDEAPGVRLPRRQAELQERLQRLEAEPGWQPRGAAAAVELRNRLGIDEERWQLLIRHRQLCRPMPLEEAGLEELAAPAEEGPAEERLVLLRELVAQLDPRQRLVVRQVVLAGWSYRRLAARMEVSPMTVQRLLQRGLASLRDQLEQRELRTDRPGCRAGSAPRGC